MPDFDHGNISVFTRRANGDRACVLTARQLDMLDSATGKTIDLSKTIGRDRWTLTTLQRMGLIDSYGCLTDTGEALQAVLKPTRPRLPDNARKHIFTNGRITIGVPVEVPTA